MSETQQLGQTFTLVFVWVGFMVLLLSAINAADSGKTWGQVGVVRTGGGRRVDGGICMDWSLWMSDVTVDEDPLEPMREAVRKMIEDKKIEIRRAQEYNASLSQRAAEALAASQTALSELHGMELALKRLGGDDLDG